MSLNTQAMQKKAVTAMRRRIDYDIAMLRINKIKTPIFVIGRDRDHNQAIFRLNYELLKEANKDVVWKSYDHSDHGFIFVKRNHEGIYDPDLLQREVVKDSIVYFNKHMKESGKNSR